MSEITSRQIVWRVLHLVTGLAAYVSFAWVLQTGGGQEKDRNGDIKEKQPVKPEWQKTVEESKSERVSGRRNGVLLRAEMDVKKDPKGDVVLIHWFLDYDGPRPPLTIFKPSLDILAYGQCSVNFYSIDQDAEAPDVGIQPDLTGSDPTWLALALGHPDRSRFITVQKKEVARGTIEVPLASIAARTRELHPGKFKLFPPARLLAYLDFRPSTRAERLNLDPWTGEVRTPWTSVPVEKLIRE